jgi:threonine dehydrogenase-like Zn-dependent dehydrogenase
MWSYRLIAPYTFERTELPATSPDSLIDGQVLVKSVALGICGSDLPAFRGVRGKLPGDDGVSAAEKDGFPMHEIVGDVVASRHPAHQPGDRVVGWASGFDGLMELVVTDGSGLAAYDPSLAPPFAVCLQPLACVLHAVEKLPPLTGRHVAVIGQGATGLLFSYVAKSAGAPHITGVDPINRTEIGTLFGVDSVVCATSDRWVSRLAAAERPDVVIEAVGHQSATLNHAVAATAPGGTVFYFGVPDDESYPINMWTMLRNDLTLKSGETRDRQRMLNAANDFARDHPELLSNYLTHTFHIDDVQAAFDLACRPDSSRIKIALVVDSSDGDGDLLQTNASRALSTPGQAVRKRPRGCVHRLPPHRG